MNINNVVYLGEVKTLLMQLLEGVSHLHDNWIIHRDLKTSNLLLNHKGILKVSTQSQRNPQSKYSISKESSKYSITKEYKVSTQSQRNPQSKYSITKESSK